MREELEREHPPAGRRVCVELNGQVYEGTFTVDGPMLTLAAPTLGVKRVPLMDNKPHALAKLLLTELVYEMEWKRSRHRPG
jgi:hypothetical protein